MGFKYKQLVSEWNIAAAGANLTNQPLTAGVPIAETYLGIYGQLVTAGNAMTLETWLNVLSEIKVTRAGQTQIEIENGIDLLALELFPWFDHDIAYTSGGTSGHFMYAKGLTIPCNFPVGHQGEWQLTVERTDNAGAINEVLSVAEGQGYYAHNWLSQQMLFGAIPGVSGPPPPVAGGPGGRHFHIVKRLYAPAATGWNSGFDIGTEGILIGLLVWQYHEEGAATAKTLTDLYQVRLDIGGETVIETDALTHQGRHSRLSGQSHTALQSQEMAKQAIIDQYVCWDFADQPWNCKGKSVVLRTNAGVAGGNIRAYPIYLVDW